MTWRTGYAGAADGLAQEADGDQRGILKSLRSSTTPPAAERVRSVLFLRISKTADSCGATKWSSVELRW